MSDDDRARNPGSSGALPDDLSLQMMRDHTLLTMLSERMHEMASYVERGGKVSEATLDECLGVHDQLLIRYHHVKEAILDAALARAKGSDLSSALAACAEEHPKARLFQERARRLVTQWRKDPRGTAKPLARMIQEEADRLAAHHRSEEERLYAGLESRLTPAVQKRLLGEFHRLASQGGVAETRLQAWASRIHPSSD